LSIDFNQKDNEMQELNVSPGREGTPKDFIIKILGLQKNFVDFFVMYIDW